MRDANHALEESPSPLVRRDALAQRLKYFSSALGIAMGPHPEASLLDMVVLIELCRDVYKRYWLPQVFGPPGRPMEAAFDEASLEIWRIAALVLSPHQREILRAVIEDWRAQNPNRISVEEVRLSEVNEGRRKSGKSDEESGLFASVKAATRSVDEMRLLGERALYYSQIAPFLLRIQAELGAMNMTSDLADNFGEIQSGSTRELVAATTLLVTRTNELVNSMQRLFGDAARNPELLKTSANMVGNLSILGEHLIQFDQSPSSSSRLAAVGNDLTTEFQKARQDLLDVGLVLIGVAFVALVAGSVLARVLGAYFTRKLGSDSNAEKNERKAA